ncbi:MAG: orotidine 5'-phosphate decarboxylase / HUMPS family protein, partial [Gemmatimonadota bacterium]
MSECPDVIVALDYADPEAAWNLVALLPENTWFKVGLELFTRTGPSVVERLVGEGRQVFLDLKLHDIPNTVAGAVRAAGRFGVRLLTVHGAGGEAMLRAAADAAGASNSATDNDLRLLAITVLTSLDDAAFASVMGPQARVEETAGR